MSKDTAAMPAHIIISTKTMFTIALHDNFNWTSSIFWFGSRGFSNGDRLRCEG
jgi:hypothetical protein